MTESIEDNTLFEVNDYEGEINFFIDIKYKVIVAENGSPILNTPHSTSLVLCEKIVRYYQYKTEGITYHYL